MSGDMLVMSKSQMDQLGANFRTQQEAVDRVIAAIQSGIENTTWQGARADHFRSAWEGQFKRNLIALRDALGEHSTFIVREREAGMAALDGGV